MFPLKSDEALLIRRSIEDSLKAGYSKEGYRKVLNS
jgi:hypothetical protein